MSILDTLQDVKKNFDPKKDKINDGGLLPSGDYPVRLLSSDFSPSKAGREQIAVTLEVVSGDAKGRKELIFLSFDTGLPEFVQEKNAKILISIAEFTNNQLTQGDLKDELTAAEALQRGIGKQFKMKLNVVPNRKNPDYPYRNYEFSPLEDSESQSEGLGIDISDEDMPF